MIMYKSIHTIDAVANHIERREIPKDFDSFMEEVVKYASSENQNTRNYVPKDQNTMVLNSIVQITGQIVANSFSSEDKEARLKLFSDSIANKLLFEEIAAQQKIDRLGKQVRRGSLIQSLVEIDAGYQYVLAKVEHSEYFTEELIRSLGFPGDNKRVWKSAVIPMVMSLPPDELVHSAVPSIGTIRVYTDATAKYWADNFLELQPVSDDEKNTKDLYTAVEHELRRSVKTVSPRDYEILVNAVLSRLKSEHIINYPDMIEEILPNGYSPEEPELRAEEIRKNLQELPEKKGFDKQFNSVPSVLSRQLKRTFHVTGNIDIQINGGLENFVSDIVAVHNESTGEKYLKIVCDNDNTFRIFAPKDT